MGGSVKREGLADGLTGWKAKSGGVTRFGFSARARARAHLQRAVTSGIFPEVPILFDSLSSSFQASPLSRVSALLAQEEAVPVPAPRSTSSGET